MLLGAQSTLLAGIDYGQYPHEPLGIVGSLPRLRSLRVSGQLSILDLVAILDECCPHKSLERISFEASVEFLQTDDPIHWAEFHQIFLKFLPRRIFLHCSEKEGGKSCAGEYRTLLEERPDLGTLIAQGELILQANHGAPASPSGAHTILMHSGLRLQHDV